MNRNRKGVLMRVALLLALAACVQIALAEDDEEVLAVVDEFFVALGMNDLESAEAMLSDHASITIVVENEAQSVSNIQVDEFFARFQGIPPGEFVEEYWDPVILRRGRLAVFWAPYFVDVSGKRSHCGIDVLSLAKHESGWKFESLVFSVEPNACEELGAPAEGSNGAE